MMLTCRLAVVLSILILVLPLQAQTWNGASSTSSNWSAGGAGGNWTNAAAPANVNPGTANVHFAGSIRTSPNQDVAWNINSLTLDAGAVSFTLGGQPLTIQGGGINALSLNGLVINNAIVIGASQSWSGGDFMSFGGPTLGLGVNTLTLAPSTFTFAINNTISGSGATALVLAGGGGSIVNLGGSTSNTFTGAVNVNNGTLQLSKTGGSAVAVGGALNIGDGAGLPGSATVSLLAATQTSTTTDVTIQTDGVLQLNTMGTTIRALNMTGGGINIGTGVLMLAGDVTINASSTGSFITATDNVNDLSFNNTTRTFTVARGSATYDLDMNGAGITAGTLIKTGPGVMRLNATTNGSLSVTLNQGTLAVGSGASLGTGVPGPLTLAGGTSQPDSANLVVANAVNLTGDTVLGEAFSGTAYSVTFNNTLTTTGARTLSFQNNGTTIFNGNINTTNVNTLTLIGSGEVDINNGNTSGVVTNHLALLEQNGGTISAALTNAAGAAFAYTAGAFSGSLDNSGLFLFEANFLAGAGYTNRVSQAVGAFTLSANGAGIDNEGTITLSSGTLTSATSITNNNLITGNGTFSGGGPLQNNGLIIPANGPIAITGGGINFNLGNIITSQGNGLVITGTSLTNEGTIQLNNSTISGSGSIANQTGGSITGTGSITTSSFVNFGGGVVSNGSAGTLFIAPSFINAGLIQLGAFNATLSGGAITNTGTIQGVGNVGNTVANSAGTLESIGETLGFNGALTNAAGGTIAVDAGSKLFVSSGLATNAGVISLSGGTFDNNGHALSNTGQISGFGSFRTGGLTNNGTVVLTGGLTTVNGAVTNSATKIFTVQFNPAIFTGFVTNNGTFNVISTTATFAGGSSGTPGLLTPGAQTTGGLEGTGSLNVTSGALLQASYIRQNSATIAGSIPLRPSSQGGDVSIVNSLAITGAGQFDLNDNDLIVNYTNSSPAATIRAYLISGFNSGNWNGTGLASSAAHADTSFQTALGYADVSSITFDNQSIAHAVIVKYTYYGDNNLDGIVNATDFQMFLDGLVAASASSWAQGDYTYDGKVDLGNDFNLFLVSYLKQGNALGELAPIIIDDTHLSASQRSTLLAIVPEPTSAAIFVAAGVGALCRRRNRKTPAHGTRL